MHHILLVEDDRRIVEELERELEIGGYMVTSVSRIDKARRALKQGVDLILLDLGLPDGNGLAICQEIRGQRVETPIIILTARDLPRDCVSGLDAGADDYVSKPFDAGELLARIRSSLRRAKGHVVETRYENGSYWIDSATRTAGNGEQRFHLAQREFDLLFFLMRTPGRAWTRDKLLLEVWSLSGGVGDSRTVDQHIRKLRQKIEPDPRVPRVITTVWGVGYRFEDLGANS